MEATIFWILQTSKETGSCYVNAFSVKNIWHMNIKYYPSKKLDYIKNYVIYIVSLIEDKYEKQKCTLSEMYKK